MEYISILFPDLHPDRLEDTDHIADFTMGILDPHVHDTAIKGDFDAPGDGVFAVRFRSYLVPPLTAEKGLFASPVSLF